MATTTENVKNKVPANRPKRKPVGMANRLSVTEKDPNFVYRWVNDENGRVAMFQEAGYEIVDPDKAGLDKSRLEGGKTVDKGVAVGNGTTAVLMRQPKEFWEEDQATKAERVNAALAGIEKNIGDKPDRDGSYGSIKIS